MAPTWSLRIHRVGRPHGRSLIRGVGPPPAVPAVDFRTERVVLVALGQRSTGGYDIRIDSVVQFQRGSVTYVTATSPGQKCGTTSALSQPVDVIRLSPKVEPIVFQRRGGVRDCSRNPTLAQGGLE